MSFYTGILLFFIGIIGGGIDVKEVKIPQITGVPRYMCFIGSLLFIILGLYLKKEIPAIAITNAIDAIASNSPSAKISNMPKNEEVEADITQDTSEDQETIDPAAIETSDVTIQPPSYTKAIQDLFGVTSPSGKLKTAIDKLTSFWFGQSFNNGTDNLHVVFFKTQTIDKSGNPEQSHSTGVDIGAITYKQTAGEWQILTKQPQFGVIGSWGDVPNNKQGNSMVKAEILPLSQNAIVFMFDTVDGMGGISDRGKSLFVFSRNAWQDVGWVQTGGDNSGNCNDKSPEGKGLPDCWSYDGTISTVTGKNAEYPDLLITYTGTEEDENSHPMPAQDMTYSFNGEEYEYIDPESAQESPKQPSEPIVTQGHILATQTRQKMAQGELDEANKRINIVWNATSKTIREALLPEQRQWLKKRENDCALQATNEEHDDAIKQQTLKLHCMAAMTDPRTEILEQKIASMEQN